MLILKKFNFLYTTYDYSIIISLHYINKFIKTLWTHLIIV